MVRTGTSVGALNTSMKLRIPENAGNFLNNWKTISFARRTLVLIYWLLLYLTSIFENTVELKVHGHRKWNAWKAISWSSARDLMVNKQPKPRIVQIIISVVTKDTSKSL
jgi:hypothetical protein